MLTSRCRFEAFGSQNGLLNYCKSFLHRYLHRRRARRLSDSSRYFSVVRDPFSAAEKAEKSRIIEKLRGAADSRARNWAAFAQITVANAAKIGLKVGENAPIRAAE
jgi:hypothetical protein